MAIGILYGEELNEYDFGPGHPFRGDRYETFLQFLRENLAEDNYESSNMTGKVRLPYEENSPDLRSRPTIGRIVNYL